MNPTALSTGAPSTGASSTGATIRVATTIAKETIEYTDVPAPTVTDGHALVRVTNLTLCGTDLHIWEDDYATELPIVQGHEFVGVITDLGNLEPGSATDLAVGDRVAVSPIFYCGSCYACSIGRVNACQHMSVYGCYQDGALLEQLNVPVEKLHKLPDGLSSSIAPLWEPTSIAMQAVNRGRPVAGEHAVVLGCGPIGLLATLYLSDLGVRVIAADTVAERCDFAKSFGASDTLLIDPTVNFPTDSQGTLLAARTAGNGPSLVIEATGMPGSLHNALTMVATAGRVVTVGISDRTIDLSMRTLPVKEVDLLGSRNSLHLVDDSLGLLSRYPDQARALITHRFGFTQLTEAFETMRSRTELVGKVAIDMPEPASR